ncbi:CHAT domain-containing protein [Mesorhizobium sp. B1-1-8]|uniref:CHAT domain-containing protein n=1 Tax=Mesorhizobium sp. B1-1-8 TaxID=2589976 RepID=UPI00112BDB1E|nr:CHAT domain-containing protein [Mesorhizobium sp. B1-1-8]UCI07353.1 CHAT domain-containing protein [Mesorhizobium sp. B1-1-8]
MDLQIVLDAADICMVLDRDDDAQAFCRTAEAYASHQPFRVRVLSQAEAAAHSARSALELGDRAGADAALARFAPELTGMAATAGTADFESWEFRQPWILHAAQPDAPDGREVAARVYHSVGLLLAASGLLSQARVTIARAGSLLGKVVSAEASVLLLRERIELADAIIVLQRGDFATAKSLGCLSPTARPFVFAPLELRRLALISRLHILGDDLATAVRSLEQVGGLVRSVGSNRAIAAWLIQAAHVLMFMNQASRAESVLALLEKIDWGSLTSAVREEVAFIRALQVARSANFNAEFTQSLSDLYGERAETEDEEKQVPLRLTQWTLRVPAYELDSEFAQRATLIRMHLDEGDLAAASEAFDVCRAKFQTVDSPILIARMNILSSLMCNKAGQFEDAYRLAQLAATQCELLGARLDEWQCNRILSGIASKCGDESLAQGARQQADRLIHSLTQGMDIHTRSVYLIDKISPHDDELEQDVVEVSRLATSGLSTRAGRLFRRDSEASRRVRRIFRRSRTAQGPREPARWMSSLRKWFATEFGGGQSVIFIVLRSTTLVVVRRGSRVWWRILSLDAVDLAGMTYAWHNALRAWTSASSIARFAEPGTIQVDFDRAFESLRLANQDIVDALKMEETFSLLDGSQGRVSVETDGPLTNLPIGALRVGGQYLIEAFTFASRHTITSKNSPTEDGPACVVSVRSAVNIATSRGGNPISFPPLPGVSQEGRAALFWFAQAGSDVIRLTDDSPDDPQPTKSSILGWLTKVSRIHFACHGSFDPGEPQSSGLVVLDDCGQGVILSLKDIEALPRVPRYIALSACYSADSFSVSGSPPIGLPYSLLRAGALTVLASFWRVTDAVGQKLIEAYCQHAQSGDLALALAKAQRAAISGAIKGDLIDAAHPYYWASYAIHERSGNEVW